MKKAIALTCLFAMFVSLAACGGTSPNSGVSIDDLLPAIKEFDDEAVINKSESEDGYTFSYKGDTFYTFAIEGATDSDEMVTTVVANCSPVDVDYFKDLTLEQLTLDFQDINNIPANRLTGEFLIVDFSNIVTTLSFNDTSKNADDLAYGLLFDAIYTPQTRNNWTYTITTNSASKTVTITAEFTGE